MTGAPATSSPLGARLHGYLDRRHCDAGEALELAAAGPAGPAAVTIERLIHGDPAPLGPGVRAEPVAWDAPAALDLQPRRVPYGSFVRVDDALHLQPSNGFTFAIWCRPTRLSGGWHVLAAKWSDDDPGFGLFIAGAGILTAGVRGGSGITWCTAKEAVEVGAWHHVALSCDPGAGHIALHVTQAGATSTAVREAERPGGRPSTAPLLLGARARAAGRAEDACDHLDGRLARPLLLDAPTDGAAAAALAEGSAPEELARVLGRWAFERQVTGAVVEDVGPHRHHGVAVNAPARAVTGPGWSGRPARRYVDAPHDYDAIHLHSDDLDDAAWPVAARVRVPADARGGIYALRLSAGDDEVTVPFVVRGTEAAPLIVLVPTLTWRAYASNRRPYTHSDDGVLDGGLGLYDLHADGSQATITSLRRPTRTLHPSRGMAGWGAHLITATLYLTDWLEAQRTGYRVLTDEQLDAAGTAALEGCRCLVLPGHSEYATAAMLDALESFLVSGGRIAYLGGNGLYWVTTLDRARPHLMEVRKSGEGDYDDDARPAPGEMQHQLSLEAGGLWARRGRPPSRLLGVDLAAHGHHRADGARGFRRLPASYAAECAWVFDGVDSPIVGAAGLNLGSAAGYEMDAVPDHVPLGVLRRTIRLARATDPGFYGPRHVPVEPASDIALSVAEGGGAVFAAGSVAWTGGLGINGYDNDVARITRNVIERFTTSPLGTSTLR